MLVKFHYIINQVIHSTYSYNVLYNIGRYVFFPSIFIISLEHHRFQQPVKQKTFTRFILFFFIVNTTQIALFSLRLLWPHLLLVLFVHLKETQRRYVRQSLSLIIYRLLYQQHRIRRRETFQTMVSDWTHFFF